MFQAIRTSPAGLATLVFVVICHCKSVSSTYKDVWIGSVSKEDLAKRFN